MNPYTQAPVVRQLFVTEPFNNTIAVIDLIVAGTAPNQVFGLGSVTRISSPALNLPIDLAPAQRDMDNVNWASNTTLDRGSDFYAPIAATTRSAHGAGRHYRGDQAGCRPARSIYVTFTRPGHGAYQGGVLELPAFP